MKMPTGDLKNNIKKLQKELRLIRYEDEVDLEGLSQGKPTALLPVYQYVFTSYSHTFAELISSTVTELFGKTDVRFIEGVYKILRDLFNYKPSISKEQFFQNGFAERKIIMCTEILKLIQEKNKSLQPPKKAATSATSTVGHLITASKPNRPKSSEPVHQSSTDHATGRLSLPATKTKSLIDIPTREYQHPLHPRQRGERGEHLHSASSEELSSNPHVVNELLQPVREEGHIHRLVAPAQPSHIQRSAKSSGQVPRHVSRQPDTSPPESSTSDQSHSSTSSLDFPPTNQITSPPRVYKEVLTADAGNTYQRRHYNCAVITPSIGRVNPEAVEIVSIPRESLPFRLDDVDEDYEGDNTIQTVAATTPVHSILEPPPSNSPVKSTMITEPEGKTRREGYSAKQELNSGDGGVTQSALGHQQVSQIMDILERYHLQRQQEYDTLSARLTLLENRFSIIEAKLCGGGSTSTGHLSGGGGSTSTGHLSDKPPVHPNATRDPYQAQNYQNGLAQRSTRYPPENLETRNVNGKVQVGESDQLAEQIVNNAKQAKQDYNTEIADTAVGKPLSLLSSYLGNDTSSLGLSPIRQVPGTPISHNATCDDTFALADTNDPRRSSTPSQMTYMGAEGTPQNLGNSLSFHTDDTTTRNLVDRIQNLFKETETMLKGN